MEKRVLALDFGASSARAMRAVMDGETLTVTELHRWENIPIEIDGRLHWNIDALFREVCVSLRRAAQAGGVDAIGIDTWGVDFGLLGAAAPCWSRRCTIATPARRHPRCRARTHVLRAAV